MGTTTPLENEEAVGQREPRAEVSPLAPERPRRDPKETARLVAALARSSQPWWSRWWWALRRWLRR